MLHKVATFMLHICIHTKQQLFIYIIYVYKMNIATLWNFFLNLIQLLFNLTPVRSLDQGLTV